MKLNEAIRIGAKQYPRAGKHFYHRQVGKIECVCVLGAAMAGAGIDFNRFDELYERFPELNRIVPDPTGPYHAPLWSTMAYLNDCQNWTRECIADWVESMED